MHLSEKYSLFIFDWDNTLVSTRFLINAIRYSKRRYWNVARASKRAIAIKPLDISNVQLKSLEEENKLLSAVYDAYLRIQAPRLKPYAIDVLKTLKSKKIKIAVFSDGRSGRLMKEIHSLGLSKYLDFASGANSFGRYKPDPAGLLYIMRFFKISDKRSIYVCDMNIDIITARLAGIDSCAISDGLSSLESLKKERPTYLMDNLSKLLKSL
ncbi:MAG: HAD family hydrolase [Candidatus Micrarchaeaceae archaeon]